MMILEEGIRQERGGRAVRIIDDPEKESEAILQMFDLMGKSVKRPKGK